MNFLSLVADISMGGLYAHIVADPQSQRAICYLK